MKLTHDKIEQSVPLLIVLVILVIAASILSIPVIAAIAIRTRSPACSSVSVPLRTASPSLRAGNFGGERT